MKKLAQILCLTGLLASMPSYAAFTVTLENKSPYGAEEFLCFPNAEGEDFVPQVVAKGGEGELTFSVIRKEGEVVKSRCTVVDSGLDVYFTVNDEDGRAVLTYNPPKELKIEER